MTKKKIFRLLFRVLLSFTLAIESLYAQTSRIDTTQTYTIPEVTVSERTQFQEILATSPTQIFTRKQITGLNALQVSDAVKHFAGVTIKDYGGIGGLKTVSIRSLGAAHTAISYDGISISNTQTGQVDIGRFSLDNVDRLSLNNGQSDNIFQPARLFASSGILTIQTLTPRFQNGKHTHINGSLKTGSWGLINPSLLFEQRLSPKWGIVLNSEWMSANGKYPYTMFYGNNQDSTSQEKRKNTEVKTLRTEVNLFGNLSDTEQWRLKAYYYQSSRGLPNATTLYYNHSSQHLWDKNIFIQSQFKKELSRQWLFQTSAKWDWSYQRYLDPDYKNLEGKLDNSYYQQEYYLSTSFLYRMLQNLSFSISTDGSVNTLQTQVNPKRYSWLTAIAGKYTNEWMTASASLLTTVIRENTQIGDAAEKHRKLSPYVGISFKPFSKEELRIRIFYKNIFRLPSFNDLYYQEVGNTTLNPESTSQYNIGITYTKELNQFIPYFSATVDAYYNKVKDKIMAVPTKNIFVWSMVNLGEVEIKGLDTKVMVTIEPWKDIRLNLSGNYTYQQALDITHSTGKTYKHQIAYTPRISGSAQARVETPWINISYSFLYSGKRYVLGQNLPENRLKGYTDHSLSVGRDLQLNKIKTSLQLEILNLLNKNYEIVRYFPMPGRSVRATFKLTY